MRYPLFEYVKTPEWRRQMKKFLKETPTLIEKIRIIKIRILKFINAYSTFFSGL